MKLKNYCFAEQYFNLFTNYFLKMLAVIELWGNQFTVKEWDIIDVKKLRVFKMKSKKRYMRNNWFRARLTKLEVISIA